MLCLLFCLCSSSDGDMVSSMLLLGWFGVV